MSRINETVIGICRCGCGEPTGRAAKTDLRRGAVKGKPARFVRGHNRTRRPNPFYRIDDATGCWIYNGYLTKDEGRAGNVVVDGRRIPAYVATYEAAKGPVPPGLVLDHLCRTPSCVNPDHLEPVTYAVNNQRGALAKLNDLKVSMIRASLASGGKRRALAREYGVSYATIKQIEKCEAWA